MSKKQELGRTVLDGRIDLTSYDGISAARAAVTSLYLNGKVEADEYKTILHALKDARMDLDSRIRALGRPIKEVNDEDEDVLVQRQEAPIVPGVTHAGPFGVYTGGRK